MAFSPSSDDLQGESPEFWQIQQQHADASHIAWCLEEVVFHSPEAAFAHLRHDPTAYALTLARLIGLVWVTGLSADNIIWEEQSFLTTGRYSRQLQAACENLAKKLRGIHRS
ncbi:hypothetical protein [Hymenobacter crusticola]|uniref:Uncharacterized protein n=1 Tax=Hymenobacter crusticola TaxID=1770526 RepID=A0A243W6T9_9BACT|nr:hypothetical protein [Hymenobacter crusticola]OUJ69928.1 hypothetical protein BXP70_25645 [Hymenobacter crusticola]